MQDVNIDLGTSPEKDLAISGVTSPGNAEKNYPCFYINVDAEDIPDEGQMLISYKIKRSTKSKDENGERTSCDIEVRSIDQVEGDADDGDEEESEDTPANEFDARMRKHMDGKESAE